MRSLLFLFLFLPLAFLCAQEELNYKISYFEDKSSALSIGEIKEKSFKASQPGVQNLGIKNTAHWFKLDLFPKSEELSQNWWIKIAYPPLDYIDYYLFDTRGDLIKTIHSGELRPFNERELSDPSFIHQLPLSKPGNYRLYIRVQTEGALQVPISILNSKDVIQEQYFPIIVAGIYYGLFIIIVLYNGVIFLYTRDKNYLLYLLFVNAFVFWQLSLDGVGVAYIWGDFPWLTERASILGTSLVTFAAILFSRSFLQSKKYIPSMDIYLKYLMYFCFALTLTATFASYHYVVKIDGLLSIIAPISLFIAGILVYKKGYRPARFYLVGWFAFLIGCVLFSLNKFNLIGGFYVMNHAQQIGSGIEMLMLSWALGDRVKSIQQKYLERVKNLNKILQKKVAISLAKERHKDKILIQQSRFAALGEMIEQIAHQWRQPLNNLALINQDLYFKFQLQKFDQEAFDDAHTKIDKHLQYMSQTIDDFRNYYNNKTEAETYELIEAIDSALSLSDAMVKYAKIRVNIENEKDLFVHNIKNEFIQVCMNIIKNAHDALIENREDEPKINIYIASRGKNIELRIEDNAGGIAEDIMDQIFNPYFTTKPESKGTGIGLYMSRSIILDHLEGDIKVHNTAQGACFSITLPKAISKQ